MQLKQLSINGFKSFAKKGELEFVSPVTAIVGPNGSGKSNVAEAFRFVLGEQSNKGMRAKSGADLIFNGSEKVARSSRASVEVLLDNSARVFPLDFDEVKIERIVHRDGQNEYLLNDSKVRLKDVQEVLAAANIGPSGHHIISQGEADRVLTASPKERREMIEDALGLKVYQYKKQEAEKKLQKTVENIEKVESLRREVAPHLKFLERQVEKMARSIALRQELVGTYHEYLKREERYLEQTRVRLEREQKEPEEQLLLLKTTLKAVEEKLSLAPKRAVDPRLAEVEEKLHQNASQLSSLLRESGKLEGQISYIREKQSASKVSGEEEKLVPFLKVKALTEELDKGLEDARTQADVLGVLKVLDRMSAAWRALVTEVSDSERVVGEKDREEELGVLQASLQECTQHIETVRKNESVLQDQLHSLKNEAEAARAADRECEHERFRLSTEIAAVERTLTELTMKRQVLERDREAWKEELQEAVALLGRDASGYRDFIIEGLADEDRSVQYDRRRQLEKLKIRLEEVGGVDPEVEREYKETKERDAFLVGEINDLNTSVATLSQLIADLTGQLNERFVVGIEKIDTEFRKFFTLMFGGGEAKLLRVLLKQKEGDEESEPVEGLEVDVKLPNKRVRGLEMLSGGERALTSIALIFAMSQVNPPLFIILDETDAALDEANSRRYGDMIEALAKKSQLILITHNRETMSRASVLYGVTMAGDGVSKLLSVKLNEAVAHAK